MPDPRPVRPSSGEPDIAGQLRAIELAGRQPTGRERGTPLAATVTFQERRCSQEQELEK